MRKCLPLQARTAIKSKRNQNTAAMEITGQKKTAHHKSNQIGKNKEHCVGDQRISQERNAQLEAMDRGHTTNVDKESGQYSQKKNRAPPLRHQITIGKA